MGASGEDRGAIRPLEAIGVFCERFPPHFFAIDAAYDIAYLCRKTQGARG